jgi:type I restriction enzyme M protein
MAKKAAIQNRTARTAKNPSTAGPLSNNGKNRPSLSVRTDGKGRIWSHIRQMWLIETPEERVRQAYVVTLHNEYGFDVEQMDEELRVAGRGSARARADVVIWRTLQDKNDRKPPLIAIECKSDNVTINIADYAQGEAYAVYCRAPFFVTHNNRETRYWRVRDDRIPGFAEEIENVPHADASDEDIEELIKKLKTFKEDEFADLLHKCHNVIRNREHLDPAAAFDEIAKVLFVKVTFERRLRRNRKNLFTAEFLDEQREVYAEPVKTLFDETKEEHEADRIFDPRDEIKLGFNTVREIVRNLQVYNLSDTKEDVKGIAFERFLGRTFRGEIGQFFTPRTIVEFMIRMLAPKEGDIVCDPASGSGGFLIRFFEIVREQILADIDREYRAYAAKIEKQNHSEAKRAKLLREKYAELQETVDQKQRDSRLWKLANRCIYGTDANDRMARTSKMNMIMHGDGHGGVHHNNGFLNVNGIFEGRFNLILTNPPFGANVEPSDHVTDADTRVSSEDHRRYAEAYGKLYKEAQARVTAAKGKPIASLFDLPKRGNEGGKLGKVKTEILFIERCLDLLKPGGRMGIVLPEGIFNNPSLAYVREFCEDRARIMAVVSLPQETFMSSGASVKASLLFLHKFTDKEAADYKKKRDKAIAEVDAKYAAEIEVESERLEAEIEAAKEAKDGDKRKAAQRELAAYLSKMRETTTREERALLRDHFDYPVFLYEAEKVGITATGEPDANELYPNDSLPEGMTADQTCLELYRRFPDEAHALDILRAKRKAPVKGRISISDPTPRRGAFSLRWAAFERWDTFFWREDFVALERELLVQDHLRLGQILHFISRPWKSDDFPDGHFQYVEVSSVTREAGITGATTVAVADAPSRAVTLIQTGDFILSTTRPYLGGFARVTKEFDRAVCSSAFSVADEVLTDDVHPDYLLLFLKSTAGLRQMERRMTGGLYPAIIQRELEKIIIPVPPLDEQKKVVAALTVAAKKIKQVRERAEGAIREIERDANARLFGTG